MKIEGEGQLLRIYIGESDRWQGRPLHEALVLAARDKGLAGATVLRGTLGFGASSRLHTAKVLRLSEDLPLVVEIIDRPDRIAAFLPVLDQMVTDGLVTLEKVNFVKYLQPLADEDELELEVEPATETPPASAGPQLFTKATDRARKIIELAKNESEQAHRGFVDSVDVMLAMIHERQGIAGTVLHNFNVTLETLEGRLREQVNREIPSDGYLESLDAAAMREAAWLRHNYAGTEHLLLALCEVRPSAATDILMQLGIQPREICEEVLMILGHHEEWQRWLADHPNM